jgi:hypothetical protein
MLGRGGEMVEMGRLGSLESVDIAGEVVGFLGWGMALSLLLL